jgi:uncharacterized protein Yka (UPF0111/DUF47 family)
MSKTETLRQSAAASNERRLERLASQIETVRKANYQSVEELALMLEPLAQSMVALVDETRQTLDQINRQSQETGEMFSRQVNTAMQSWREAAVDAQTAANRLDRAGSRIEWSHYAVALMTGIVTTIFVSVLWHWVAPPVIENRLDPQAVAQYLKPAVIAALKPSRSK